MVPCRQMGMCWLQAKVQWRTLLHWPMDGISRSWRVCRHSAWNCTGWQNSKEMEILDLRHFSSTDLRPLLEDEIAVWARLLSWDYSGSAEMILRYLDSKILPGYAAIERGSV